MKLKIIENSKILNYLLVFFMLVSFSCGTSLSKSDKKSFAISDDDMVESVKSESRASKPKKSAKIKTKKDMVTDKSKLTEEEEKPTTDEPEPTVTNNKGYGVLTAGEWNDLDHWEFWKAIIKSDQWAHMPQHWSFNIDDRLAIVLKNSSGKYINNVELTLKSTDGKELWKSYTDINGRAELWPNIFSGEHKDFSLTMKSIDGKESTINIDLKKKINYIKFDAKPTKITKLDITLVIDATGSMGDEINYLKKELQDIVEKVNKKTKGIDTRIALVFYRDHGDDYLIKDFKFDDNISSVISNLSAQSAGGGGDFPEAVDEGLENAIKNKNWSTGASTRLLFLVLDAPPHKKQEVIAKMQSSVKLASEKGIKIIPVVASGIDKETEFLMRFISCATNGTYVFLTDDSGIGNSHLKPTVGKYQVEMLNDLLIRLIMKYVDNNPV